MLKLSTVFCVAALAVFATSAFADDPFMVQDGSSCPGPPWCGSSTQAVDSATGIDTIEYTFSSAVIPDIAADWSGWVEGTIGGNEAELLHFVTSGTGSNTKYSVFLYCGASVAICSSKDDVLPSYENGNVTATWNMFSSPTPYQGTYYPEGDSTNPLIDSGTNPGAGQYSANNPIGYALGAPATGAVKGTIVPEPSSLVLLGAMMVGLAAFVGAKFSARA